MFGLNTSLLSLVRQQRFSNYGHEEMRGDSPCTCMFKTYVSTIQCSIEIFCIEKTISTNAQNMSGKIENVSFKMVSKQFCNQTFSYRFILAAILNEKRTLSDVNPFLYTF